MLEDLSEILVYSLDEREQATLEQEIHVTECYIKILKERYGELFLVEWSYEEEVLAIPVVKFVLQPLLENAVNHGIREKRGGGTGRIRIKIFVKGEKLHIHVVDNGAGIEKRKSLPVCEKRGWKRAGWVTAISEYSIRIKGCSLHMEKAAR